VWSSPGLRLAVAGLIVFFAGAAALLVSNLAGSVLMLAGGLGVWSGFIWTLIGYYVSPRPPGEM
jgi:hypothetical protein